MTSLKSSFADEADNLIQNDPHLAAAADALWQLGKAHGWFDGSEKSWRDMDPLGRLEFLEAAASIIDSYRNQGPNQGNQPVGPAAAP